MGGSASVDDAPTVSLVINGSAICQADSRGTGGSKGDECGRERSSEGGRRGRKERNQERGQG